MKQEKSKFAFHFSCRIRDAESGMKIWFGSGSGIQDEKMVGYGSGSGIKDPGFATLVYIK
jgi:hypothetical protein